MSVPRYFWIALKTIFKLSLTFGLARLGLILQEKMQKVLDSYASEKKKKKTELKLLF